MVFYQKGDFMDDKKLIQIDNLQKHENYREQFSRLKKALSAEFYLEAIFIEYTIIEDRTESVLRHAGKWDGYVKKLKGREPTLNSKTNYIKVQANSGDKMLKKYFSDSLLDDILVWKEDRNRLIHALLKQSLTAEDVSEIAHMGERLTKEIRTRATNFSRAVERKIKTMKGKTK